MKNTGLISFIVFSEMFWSFLGRNNLLAFMFLANSIITMLVYLKADRE